MGLTGSVNGYMTLEITGADIPGSLARITETGICLKKIQLTDSFTVLVTVAGRDYSRIERVLSSRGDQIRVKKGIAPNGGYHALRMRPVLVIGLALLLLLSLWMPTRVLFVQVEGNISVPERLILEAAGDCGLCFGASRREVRSERMKNALLEAIPQLQWAGINTSGCIAIISVRERALEKSPEGEWGVGNLVAGMDGVILSATATRGNLLCAPGQAVAAGDILISGYTDCGLTIRAEQAEGEVFAATNRDIRVIAPTLCRNMSETGAEMKKISLLIGKKRINLWKDSGFWDATCDRMYEENYITLPGGFQLPFGWSVERSQCRELREMQAEPEQLRELLAAAGESYLRGQMVAGTIRKSDLSFEDWDGFIQMTGEYGCEEMIGFRQRLEIGDINGKSD